MKTTKSNHWVLIVVLNLLTIGWKGYQYDTLDQHSTLPVLKKRIDPQLYPRDFLLRQEQNAFSLFDVVMEWPARLLGVECTFSVSYLVATSAMALLIWQMGLVLFKSREEALLATVACLCMKWNEGAVMAVYDTYLAFRTLAFAFSLAAYYLVLRRRIVWAAVVAGIELTLHPLTAVATAVCLSVMVGYYCWRGLCRKRDLLAAAMIYGVWAGVLAVQVLGRTGSAAGGLFDAITPELLGTIKTRFLYMFYTHWPSSGLLHIVLFPALFIIFYRARSKRGRHLLPAAAVGTGVFLNLVALAFADLLIVPMVMRLQLGTARRVVSLFTIMYLAAGVWRLAELAWRRAKRERGLGTEAGQAAAMALLLGWLVTSAGAYSSGNLSSPAQSGLLVKWAIPYVLLLTLALARDMAKTSSILCGLCIGALVLVCVLWLGLVGFAVCAGGGCLVWAYWQRYTSNASLGIGLGAALLIATASEVASTAAHEDKSLLTDWIRVPGMARRGPKRELTEWMRTQTPRHALFVVPPFERGLRAHGERSVFVTSKDGGPLISSGQGYAEEWARRMQMVLQYPHLREPHFAWFGRTYGVDYAVTDLSQRLRLPVAYENERFRVYDLRGVVRVKPEA